MVARMLHLRRNETGWGEGVTWSKREARAQQSFYDELGERIRTWRAEGAEVVLAGDFNEELVEGKRLHQWCIMHHLVDMYSKLAEAEAVRGRYRTYVGKSTNHRRIDHVLVSAGLGATWGAPPSSLLTAPPSKEESDHLALVMSGLDWRTLVCPTVRRPSHVRGARRRARARLANNRPPPRISKKLEPKYAKLVAGTMPVRLQDMVTVLDRAAGWCKELWQHRGYAQEELEPRVGHRGKWVMAVDWEDHCASTVPPSQCAPGAASLRERFDGSWQVAWGSSASLVRSVLTELATAVEGMVGKTLIQAAYQLHDRPPEARPKLSRRRYNGWFPQIGQYRRAIGYLNRMLTHVRLRELVRLRRVAQRSYSNTVLHDWAKELVKQDPPPAKWRWRRDLLVAKRAELSKVMHGCARRERRSSIAEAVAKRERAFHNRKYRAFILFYFNHCQTEFPV